MTKKKIWKIIGWTLAIVLSVCLVFPLPFLAIGSLIYIGIYNSKDHVEYDKSKLKKDAKIVLVSTKRSGLKGNYKCRTTVFFDDGFKYISHDTNREDKFLSYRISLTKEMKESIEGKAIAAHFHAMGSPQYKCWDCGYTFEGVGANACPKCGSDQIN